MEIAEFNKNNELAKPISQQNDNIYANPYDTSKDYELTQKNQPSQPPPKKVIVV
jgi:hypothetical protein